MKCVDLNVRGVIFILLSVVFNGVHHFQTGNNRTELSTKEQNQKNGTINDPPITPKNTKDEILHCPMDANCTSLHPPCVSCNFNYSCVYGKTMTANCTVTDVVKCNGPREFQRTLLCRYCYQTEPWEQVCNLNANCNSIATPRSFYKTNCFVKDEVFCLGMRIFHKNVLCNWTGGYRWSTALILSITLGGFGADRFYLGHWQEGIGKLFSFGGLGVWTLIDVILISLHYLGPADGSLYL